MTDNACKPFPRPPASRPNPRCKLPRGRKALCLRRASRITVVLCCALLAAVVSWPPSAAAGSPEPVSPRGLADCLKAHLGRPFVLVYWASWCQPCRHYKEKLANLRARYPEDRLPILGVALDTDADRVHAYLAQHALPFPTRVADKELVTATGRLPVPTTILYRGDGTEYIRLTGDVRQERLDYFVGRLLELEPTAL